MTQLSPPSPSYFNVHILNSNRQLPDEPAIESGVSVDREVDHPIVSVVALTWMRGYIGPNSNGRGGAPFGRNGIEEDKIPVNTDDLNLRPQ